MPPDNDSVTKDSRMDTRHLKYFIAAAEETTIILVAFVISVWQYRRGAVDEVTRSDGGSQ